MTSKLFKICLFSILSLSFLNPCWAETIRYVSDNLTIPMRTGTTSSHKILKFLHSGMPVEVKEVSEDGKHTWVRLVDSNKLGWVETRLLMDRPHAKVQITKLNEKITSQIDENKSIKNELTELKQHNNDLKNKIKQLEKDYNNAVHNFEALRESAAHPIEIAELNRKLEQEIIAQNNKNKKLRKENIILSDENIKEWFMIGGGVSISSLILGLLITRISWKRKRSWGGNSF